jgi:hypothetical protein
VYDLIKLTISKFKKMNEHLKHFLVTVGAVVLGVAVYNLVAQPIILTLTSSMTTPPASTTTPKA